MLTVTDCWERVEAALAHSRTVLLTGPTGTGKTHAALYAGLKPGGVKKKRNVYAVTLDSGTMVHELRGTQALLNGNQVWMDGPGTLAAREDWSRLVLNEIDRGSDEVQGFLYGLCDSAETACFTLPTGEVIRPAKGFQIVATMNGEAEDLPEGLQSRFPVRIRVAELAQGILDALPEDLRVVAAGSIDATQDRRIDVRQWQVFASLRESTGSTDMALSLVFGDRATDVQDLLNLSQSQGS